MFGRCRGFAVSLSLILCNLLLLFDWLIKRSLRLDACENPRHLLFLYLAPGLFGLASVSKLAAFSICRLSFFRSFFLSFVRSFFPSFFLIKAFFVALFILFQILLVNLSYFVIVEF